jgi:hypothetical protein
LNWIRGQILCRHSRSQQHYQDEPGNNFHLSPPLSAAARVIRNPNAKAQRLKPQRVSVKLVEQSSSNLNM